MKYRALFLIIALAFLVISPAQLHANDSLNVSMRDQVFDFWYSLEDIDASGDYAYVVGRNTGLHIVDIANPDQLEVVGFKYLWDAYRVEIFGNIAVVASHSNQYHYLNLLDISDPDHPDILSSIQFEHYSYLRYEIEGDYLYVSFFNYSGEEVHGTVEVYNISDPYEPEWISSYSFEDDTIYEFMICDQKLYIPHITSEGLYYFAVLDISDPTFISEVSDTLISAPTRQFYFLSMAGDSSTIYFSANDDLWILDVSDPENVTPLGSLTVQWDMCEIALKGDYIISINNLQMRVIDVSDPTQPTEVDFIEPEGIFANFSILGDELYVLIGPYASQEPMTHNFAVLDISDEMNITEISQIDNSRVLSNIVKYRNYLYLHGWSYPELVDITDPDNMVHLAQLDFQLKNSFIFDDFLFNFSDNSIEIYALNNTEAHQLLYASNNPLKIEKLCKHEDYYLALSEFDESTVYVLELNSPDVGFEVVSSFDGEAFSGDRFYPDEIVINGDIIYLSGYFRASDDEVDPDLVILELDHNGTLSEIDCMSIMETNFDVRFMASSDNYLYLCNNNIVTMDISDPDDPRFVSMYENTNYIEDICYGDGNLYCAVDDGFSVIDMNDPEEPVETGYYYFDYGQSRQIEYANNTVFLSSYQLLRSFDVSQTSDIEDGETPRGLPTGYSLEKVYPNPFNPTLNVSITLPEKSNLRLSVTNVLGQEVAMISDRSFNAGYHNFTFNGSDLSSGVYFVHARVDGKMNQVKKVVLMK